MPFPSPSRARRRFPNTSKMRESECLTSSRIQTWCPRIADNEAQQQGRRITWYTDKLCTGVTFLGCCTTIVSVLEYFKDDSTVINNFGNQPTDPPVTTPGPRDRSTPSPLFDPAASISAASKDEHKLALGFLVCGVILPIWPCCYFISRYRYRCKIGAPTAIP